MIKQSYFSRIFLLLALSLCFLFIAQDTSATTYYINPSSGSDSNNGITQSTAYRTIQKAVDTAISGDNIQLASGIYAQDVISKRDGTAKKPILISGPRSAIVNGGGNGRVIEINHSYIELDGFTVDGLTGDGNTESDYRDKLIYVHGKGTKSGPTGLIITNMLLTNGGGECLRLRYFVQHAEIAHNEFQNCGVHDFKFAAGGKNGEAIYVGTSSNQWNDGKNPTADPDESDFNWIHHNTFDTQGNECVDIKEGAQHIVVEYNSCTGQLDSDSAGFDSRGDNNIFRFNKSFGNLGAGIRLGGHNINGHQYGVDNWVFENEIYQNDNGGIKFMVSPQDKTCDNVMSGNTNGNAVGSFGSQFAPTNTCPPQTIQADLNNDNTINIFDYNIMISDFEWYGTPYFKSADIDSNGQVDIFDYNYLLSAF